MVKRLIKLFLYIVLILVFIGFAYQLFFHSKEVSSEGKEIKIGLIAPLTGSNESGGLNMKNGVELAVNRINQNGGIAGTRLSLVIYDDQGIPESTVKGAKELIFIHNVEAIIGPFSSDCALAIKGLINNCGTPLISPVAMVDELNLENDYIFRNTLGATTSQQKFNQFSSNINSRDYVLLEGFVSQTLGILWQNDAWGFEMQELVKKDLEALNRSEALIFSEPFGFDQKSYLSLLDAYGEDFPDLLYLISSGKESIQIVRDAREAGFTGLIYGEGGLNYADFDTELGPLADGCLFSTQWHPSFSTPMSDVFLKEYLRAYDELPNMFAAISYEAVYILRESLTRVIHFLPKDNFREILQKDLSVPRKINGITGPIYFDEKGQCDRPMFTLQKRWDGKAIQSFIIYPKRYSQSEIKWNFDYVQ